MATLEMSKELDGLFDRLRQGVGLITPPEQDIFTKAVKTHRTQELLREALETFNDRKIEDIEYAWLEANLVFEVARRLVRSGVPALTVRDEFVVPEGMEDVVREFMYTTEFWHL